jgi:hypothetical protein
MNALSAFATNPLTDFPATNTLQKIVVLLVTLTNDKCVIAMPPVSGLAKVEINLKAFGYINGVGLLPGYRLGTSSWPYSQKNVAISANLVGNTKH